MGSWHALRYSSVTDSVAHIFAPGFRKKRHRVIVFVVLLGSNR